MPKTKNGFQLADALSAVKRNIQAETEGVWIDLPDIEQDIDFRIISADNEGYNDFVFKKVRQYKEQNKSKFVPERVLNAIMREGTAKHLVIDWRGEGTKNEPFDRDQVVAIFTDPAYSLLADYVHDQTSKAATFRKEMLDEAVKN